MLPTNKLRALGSFVHRQESPEKPVDTCVQASRTPLRRGRPRPSSFSTATATAAAAARSLAGRRLLPPVAAPLRIVLFLFLLFAHRASSGHLERDLWTDAQVEKVMQTRNAVQHDITAQSRGRRGSKRATSHNFARVRTRRWKIRRQEKRHRYERRRRREPAGRYPLAGAGYKGPRESSPLFRTPCAWRVPPPPPETSRSLCRGCSPSPPPPPST